MSSRDLLDWLDARHLLVADGAMGTALQAAGLPPGGCPETWNLERPEVVEAILRRYVEAGAEIIETNTFGASPPRLDAHGLSGSCREINRRAAEIGRRSAGDAALVAGSIGPCGQILAPLGSLGEDEALEGFRRQADALAEGGADLLIVETMIDLREAVLATRAAAATGLPVAATLTFEATPRGPFTVMGVAPRAAATALPQAGAAMVGVNCGTGPGGVVEVVEALRATTDVPILVQPNAGLPTMSGTQVIYPEAPADMARWVVPLVTAGATIVGGCCGTTMEHVRAVAAEIRRCRADDAR